MVLIIARHRNNSHLNVRDGVAARPPQGHGAGGGFLAFLQQEQPEFKQFLGEGGGGACRERRFLLSPPPLTFRRLEEGRGKGYLSGEGGFKSVRRSSALGEKKNKNPPLK